MIALALSAAAILVAAGTPMEKVCRPRRAYKDNQYLVTRKLVRVETTKPMKDTKENRDFCARQSHLDPNEIQKGELFNLSGKWPEGLTRILDDNWCTFTLLIEVKGDVLKGTQITFEEDGLSGSGNEFLSLGGCKEIYEIKVRWMPPEK